MKVGIITFHFPYNCGAVLQCFALQTVLESMDYEASVINYRPWYHQNRYTPLKNPVYWGGRCFANPGKTIVHRLYHGADGFLRTVHSWRNYPEASKKENKFRPFVKKYLNETRVYRTLKGLQKKPPVCGAYIAGSDQLWNTAITDGGFDGAYFLKFGSKDTLRMTYSVGVDLSKVASPEKKLTGYLEGLDVISMREEKWAPVVEEASSGKLPVHIDLDPTLLLKAEEYTEHLTQGLPVESEPYILTYTMGGETQKQIYNAAKMLSEKLKMRVIDVSGDPGFMNRKVKDNRLCGPDEFVQYIKNASYVVTNSFHGTVFSILFQKKFVTIPHAVTGNRVTELLDKLGLSERYFKLTQDAVDAVTNEIAYDGVMEKLEELRGESRKFLQESLRHAKQ